MTELVVTMLPRPAASIDGSAARVVRTAAIRFSVSDAVHCSSVTARKPPSARRHRADVVDEDVEASVAAVAAPRARRRRRRWTGRPGRTSTCPRAASASSSSLASRAPATTCTPSSTNASVTARPMPLLAPVTTATAARQPELHRSEPLALEPCSTASATSFHPLSTVSEWPRPSNCFSSVTAVESRYCLKRRPGHHVGHGVVGGARRSAAAARGCRCRCRPWPASAARSWPPPPGTAAAPATGWSSARTARRTPPRSARCRSRTGTRYLVSDTALCRLAGLPSAGRPARSCASGSGSTPLICAGSIATPAAADALAEQLLGDEAAEGVADDDRRRRQTRR